ncbi:MULTISPECIES: hypothetical protein [Photobacterium]|uniref:Lipoprotein n=1 Tax=Photobacterium ganghwense TaxID=320778 RepID=A0A0J1H9C1_9GAMM|nr:MULTISPECIES: hypothetical protein [Photobacterium]KLV08290.1 hypothetical protein ABT57_16035 [Photobacterium ganghwense]MBV1842759.1 hypothetical protein [Photobacterium ganghwense]PSU07425.1 hypothetical protein C9I92_17070 [Photobacterium ganghwense]QSV16165.1 hypothetical protein FH974_23325 [Photobacterium ganghwense]
MKKMAMFAAMLMVLTTTGCQLTHVEGEVDGVNIRATTNDRDYGGPHSHGGGFCPPGQAKKGNC